MPEGRAQRVIVSLVEYCFCKPEQHLILSLNVSGHQLYEQDRRLDKMLPGAGGFRLTCPGALTELSHKSAFEFSRGAGRGLLMRSVLRLRTSCKSRRGREGPAR